MRNSSLWTIKKEGSGVHVRLPLGISGGVITLILGVRVTFHTFIKGRIHKA